MAGRVAFLAASEPAYQRSHESKASALKGIESVKRNAPMPRSTTRPTARPQHPL